MPSESFKDARARARARKIRADGYKDRRDRESRTSLPSRSNATIKTRSTSNESFEKSSIIPFLARRVTPLAGRRFERENALERVRKKKHKDQVDRLDVVFWIIKRYPY